MPYDETIGKPRCNIGISTEQLLAKLDERQTHALHLEHVPPDGACSKVAYRSLMSPVNIPGPKNTLERVDTRNKSIHTAFCGKGIVEL